jgi:hypothetical protein
VAGILAGNVATKVIFYARRADKRIHSMYTQNLKNMVTTLEPNEYVRQAIRGDKVSRVHSLLAAWADGFGEEAICLRVQEPQQMVGASLIDDFAHSIGLRLTEEQRVTARLNETPGLKTLSLFRQLTEACRELGVDENWWELYRRFGSAVLRYGERCGWNSEPVNLFSAELRKEICETFRAEEEKAAERFLNRVDSPLFEEPIKDVGPTQSFCDEPLEVSDVLQFFIFWAKRAGSTAEVWQQGD